MIRVTLKSNSFELQSRTITWTIESSGETLGNYRMDLYRGETFGQETPFYQSVVSGLDFTNLYNYIDTTISGLHLHSSTSFWYKAFVYNVVTQESAWTTEITDEPIADKVARRIWQFKSLALKEKFGGTKFVVLKKKTLGDRCGNCWDEYTQRRTLDYCEVCFDTGISGGYYQPIPALAMMSASPNRHQMQLWGDWAPGDCIIFTNHHPHVEPRDVFVDIRNRRWEAVAIRTIEKGLALIEQDIQVRRIPLDDIIYTISVSGYFGDSEANNVFAIIDGEPI